MGTYVVRDSAVVKAPTDRVWRALTDPELTRRYFYHARVESSWLAGQPIVFRSKVLGIVPFTLRGTITEIVPGRILGYRLEHFMKPGQASMVRIVLESVDAQSTKVSVTDDVGEWPGAQKRYARSVSGWQKILRGLTETAA